MASFIRAINKDISKSIGYRLDLSTEKVIFLSLVDFVFTQTWVNLLSTASWRGVWNLLDILLAGETGLWKDAPYTDCAVTCSLAAVLNILIFLLGPQPASTSTHSDPPRGRQ